MLAARLREGDIRGWRMEDVHGIEADRRRGHMVSGGSGGIASCMGRGMGRGELCQHRNIA